MGSSRKWALAARSLGLPGNPAQFVKIGTRKDLSRKTQARSGLRTPWFQCLNLDQSTLTGIPEGIPYPCIAKPVSLSASRGVIRVNNRKELPLALTRIKNIIDASGSQHPRMCLLEKYIPGREYVFEGLLEGGKLVTLAIFSKPTYMAGPFFEETIYVSCPKLSNQIKRPLVGIVQAACKSYGWVHGPVHAECRANRRGLWIIEIAPRTIGGSCGKILETYLELLQQTSSTVRNNMSGMGVAGDPIPARIQYVQRFVQQHSFVTLSNRASSLLAQLSQCFDLCLTGDLQALARKLSKWTCHHVQHPDQRGKQRRQ